MKNSIKNILLLAIALCFSYLVAEIILRLFLPQPLVLYNPGLWRPDSLVQYRHQESTSGYINSGEGKVFFITDSNGFRVNEMHPDHQNKETAFSILMLGDSYIEAVQVEGSKAIPGFVQNKLESKYKKHIEISNAGVAGWSPNHYLIETKNILSRDSYNLAIIFLFIQNDIVKRKIDRFDKNEYTRWHKFKFPTRLDHIFQFVLLPLNDRLSHISHFWVFLKRKSRFIRMKFGLSGHNLPELYYKNNQYDERFVITGNICEEIDNAFKEKGIETSFILIPHEIQLNKELLEKYIKMWEINRNEIDVNYPTTRINNELIGRKLNVIDPTKIMVQKINSGIKLYGEIDEHFNEKGHELISNIILPIISKHLDNEILK